VYILGISAYYHDAAACLIKDGIILSAAQEERFSRVKNDASFPTQSIQFCLLKQKIILDEVDYVVFYDKPFLKFDRIFETYLSYAPSGLKNFIASFPVWIKDKLFQKITIIDQLKKLSKAKINWNERVLFSEHHLSHAASSFFPSPFESASILTMDGVGEWATTSIGFGDKNDIKITKEIHFPHSIGLLYSAFTYFTGFKVNSGEYKMMGLAPYGKPIYSKLIRDYLIDIKDDGSYALDMSYFDYCTNLKMTNQKFNELFKCSPREPESLISKKYIDIASSIQQVTEELVIKLAKNIKNEHGSHNLCMAGGVALNCVANGKLLRENIFKNIWVQPASGDAGGCIGAALGTYHIFLNNKRKVFKSDQMNGSFLGPEYTQSDINFRLKKIGAIFEEYKEKQMIIEIAQKLKEGMTIGLLNGAMEFGPRSLGNRSILADPRIDDMQKKLNLKIKFRESFRPFAPIVLAEDAAEWFDIKNESPYMLFTAQVKNSKIFKRNAKAIYEDHEGNVLKQINEIRSVIPAVTHVDYSARVQTIDKKRNPYLYALLLEFKKLTKCSVLINTSFNVRGEPIVNTPEDAFKCFMKTNLDILVVGNAILYKNKQIDNNTISNIQAHLATD
jgi:carbamoyltransferase